MANRPDPAENELIQFYFLKGFEYNEILLFMSKYHGIEMSLRTLKRRLRSFALKRRNAVIDHQECRRAVTELVNGPGNLRGYRAIWHSLQLQGMRVPRGIVQQLVHEIDPEGTDVRRSRRLRRRVYWNVGPNYAWHCDGYDKLKPYGFPVHGCIDGYSRKILWLYVTKSNNFPSNIAAYYLEAVSMFGGCPVKLITDAGTENGTMAGIHSFFRNDPDSHRFVPSPRNQRIECWWSFLRRSNASWWMNHFKDLCDDGIVDLNVQMEKELLWFCYAEVLQRNLDEVKNHWNSHYIRPSRHETVPGRPDSLYYLPESHNAMPNLLETVPDNEMNYAKEHLVEYEYANDYEDYFRYIIHHYGLQKPAEWRDAFQFFTLMKRLVNGQD